MGVICSATLVFGKNLRNWSISILQIMIRVGPKWADGWARAFIVASMEGRGEAGQTGLGLATQNNFGKLWGRGAVPVLWYLLLG